jgi:hypothetical protein
MVLLGQESIPMPPMRLILTDGSGIVLSSCTSQGKGYVDVPPDGEAKRTLLTRRRLLSHEAGHVEQPFETVPLPLALL